MACLTMARLSDLPDVQAHWLMMAQAWFRLAEKADDPPSDPSKERSGSGRRRASSKTHIPRCLYGAMTLMAFIAGYFTRINRTDLGLRTR